MSDPRNSKWGPPGKIEMNYREEVDRLIAAYFKVPTAAGLGEITTRLVEWGQVGRVFRQYAERAASSMVTQVAAHSARTWREAATRGSRSRVIYEALQREMAGPVGRTVKREIRQSADLITAIPRDLAREIARYIGDQQQQGVRHETIARDLGRRYPDMRRSKVLLIARTQTSSSATAVTRARAETIGFDWYEWNTSEDIRVRPSHRKMDKVLVPWAHAPAPEALIGIKSTLGHYHAGQCPNCRCDGYPLTSVNEVRWPHRVYWGERIQWMTRAAFINIAPAYRIAA